LNPELAKRLAGNTWYNVERVMDMAEYIVENTKIDLLIAPVWVPSINDDEIPKIIEFALDIGAGKRWPPLGIQKYEAHIRGRRPPGVRSMKWRDFYSHLKKWEGRYNVHLILKRRDFGIHKRKMLPIPFKIRQKLWVEVVAPGLLKGEVLAVPKKRVRRVITIVGVDESAIGSEIKVEIIRNKHNIYLARPTV